MTEPAASPTSASAAPSSNPTPAPPTTPEPATIMANTPPQSYDYLAALLSYLLPGMGQIYRGRTAKGIVFFVCLNALFFYGMWLGSVKNVYLPAVENGGANVANIPGNLWARQQFAGQFFIGVAAWPAVAQYFTYDPAKDSGPLFGTFQRQPRSEEIQELQRNHSKTWDLAWVYTVIAGVLNLLVIYDALTGPAFREISKKQHDALKQKK